MKEQRNRKSEHTPPGARGTGEDYEKTGRPLAEEPGSRADIGFEGRLAAGKQPYAAAASKGPGVATSGRADVRWPAPIWCLSLSETRGPGDWIVGSEIVERIRDSTGVQQSDLLAGPCGPG